MCFTVEQADSILSLIDLQRVDLWEARQKARIDSTYLALEVERLKDVEDTWYEKMFKQPTVWLLLGVYLGVRAAQ